MLNVDNYNISALYGMELYPSIYLLDRKTVQARKHRQKRINKKWCKRYGYKTIETPSKKIFIMGNKIIAQPKIIELIKREMKAR